MSLGLEAVEGIKHIEEGVALGLTQKYLRLPLPLLAHIHWWLVLELLPPAALHQ